MTTYGKKRWRRRLEASLRRHTRYWVLIGVGALLLAGAGTAAAAIVLRGQGTLVAPSYETRQLLVSGERLSAPLLPGRTADLIFKVRNPNGFPVRVDRVAVSSALRKAKPAGCAVRVSGPVLRPGGYGLPSAQRVTVPGGGRLEVTVRNAFRLAVSAAQGCGFTVGILVNATQVPVAPSSSAPDLPLPPTASLPTPTPPAEVPTPTPPVDESPVEQDPADTGGDNHGGGAMQPPPIPAG